MDSRELAHTSSVKVLSDLLARLEAAEGANSGIDSALAVALGEWTPPRGFTQPRPEEYPWQWSKKQHNAYQPHDPYTASLDASLALVERTAPTFTADLTIYRTNGGDFQPHALARLFCPYGEISEYRGDAKTPALALLCALVKALIARDFAGSDTSEASQVPGIPTNPAPAVKQP